MSILEVRMRNQSMKIENVKLKEYKKCRHEHRPVLNVSEIRVTNRGQSQNTKALHQAR